MSRSTRTLDSPYGVDRSQGRRLVEHRAARGAVVAARRREQEPADPGVAGEAGQADAGEVVDVVGQGRVEVAERIVRQRGQVDDRVDPVELLHGDVAQVGVDLRDRRQPVGVAERAAAIQVGVEPDDLVTGRLEDGDEDGADVAEMTGDENPHRDQCLPPMPVVSRRRACGR